MNIYLLAVVGMLLGVSLAGPPGPVTAILVDRATKSVLRGVAVGMGAMTADFILMVVILLFGNAAHISRFDNYIYILGSIFFFYLAYLIARSKEEGQDVERGRSGYMAGLTIGLINPMQIGWWFTAGLSVLQQFGEITILFLFVGIVIWVFFLSILVYTATARYGAIVKTGIRAFSVASLSFFGLLFIYLAVSGFLNL